MSENNSRVWGGVIVLEQEGTISEICEWFANVAQLEKRAMLS